MQTARPFSLLATVYDAIMDDIDYEAWSDFILDATKKRGWAGTQGARLWDVARATRRFPFLPKVLRS